MIDRRWYSAEVDDISCRKWPRIRRSRIRKGDDWTGGTWSKNGRGTIGCGTWPRNTWLTRSSSRASIHGKWTICWVKRMKICFYVFYISYRRGKSDLSNRKIVLFSTLKSDSFRYIVTLKRFVKKKKKKNTIQLNFLSSNISYYSSHIVHGKKVCIRWKFFLRFNYELKYEKKKKTNNRDCFRNN